MDKKRTSFAKRITGRILLWMVFVVLGLAYILFHFEGNAIRDFYSEIYRNKMMVANEYTRRVISDVYVAVTNNIYYLEHSLDDPDAHKMTMERIVKSGTRIRSCGISFIEDYYPQKGHRFCPFAWRNVAHPDVIYSQDMGDADQNYLYSDWFIDIVKSDSARWSDPFYDGHDKKTPLSAYNVPIHDAEGRVVAVLGADVSLDWLTAKLNEADSTVNKYSMLMASKFEMESRNFIINYDGTYLTHSDESNIIKGNFFKQLKSCNGGDVETLANRIRAGLDQEAKSSERFLLNGEECYVFYMPVKYTKWMMVSVIPCHAIDIIGYLNAGAMLLIILLAMLVLVLVAYYSMKNAIEPLNRLTHLTDEISKGHYNTPLPEVKHNDEIGQLRDAIGEIQYTLSS